jgi:hypothetical protein
MNPITTHGSTGPLASAMSMFTHPPTWQWTPKPKDYTTPLPAIAMEKPPKYLITTYNIIDSILNKLSTDHVSFTVLSRDYPGLSPGDSIKIAHDKNTEPKPDPTSIFDYAVISTEDLEGGKLRITAALKASPCESLHETLELGPPWQRSWARLGPEPPQTALTIPTRAEYRAAFAEALQHTGYGIVLPSHALAIRAAVEVVLGDLASDTLSPTTACHRAQFLALADAIEGAALEARTSAWAAAWTATLDRWAASDAAREKARQRQTGD